MTARHLLLSLFLAVLFIQVLSDTDGKRSKLSEKAKEFLKEGKLDKLSREDLKKVKPKDVANITRDKLKGAGEKFLKNLTKIVGKGGKKDVEKLADKLNCSQLGVVLNETKKWDCSVLRGLEPSVDKCRKEHAKKPKKDMSGMPNYGALARCGLLKDVGKDEFKKLAKEGAFKDASKETKKKLGKKARDVVGKPKNWTKDDLDAMKDFIGEIPVKDLKDVRKDVLKETLREGGGKKLDKQRRSDIFRHLFRGQKNITSENITWACDSGFESELRPKDIKHLPEKTLKSHAKCFGSDRAHASVRKEFTKRLCSRRMNFDNYTAKACVHSLSDMKPSDLKNSTVLEKLLDAYLNLTDKKKPKLKKDVCRKLAAAFMKKYKGNPRVKPGPLVKCMNKTAMDIVKDKEDLKEIAKSKENKALRRQVLDELLKNKTKYADVLLDFVGEMGIEELKSSIDADILGLDDDDDDDDEGELLEEDENKGACDESDEEEEDDEDENDGDEDMKEDRKKKIKFCNKAKRFIVLKKIGNVSELTMQKIIKIARLLLHGGLTEKDIQDLNDEEFGTIVAILSRRERVFSFRQAVKIVKKYKMLYKNNTDALEDMEGMLVFLNKTELESILPDNCEEVIRKLRESVFLWKMKPKDRMDHAKFVVSKCISDLASITADQLVNLGHLIGWLDPSQFDKIPGQLLVDNLEALRDNLEEQMKHKGFGHVIKNITEKIVDRLGGPSALTADHIAEFGVLRKGLDKDDVKNLQPEALAELKLYEQDLTIKAVKQLFESGQGRVTSRRKRATTDYSTEDADFFLALGQTILGLPAAEITNIQNVVFEDIVGTVSEISGWENSQLMEWAKKAKAAWGDVETFTTDELLSLNEFAKGFTAAELYKMDFSNNDVIESFGSISGYSSEQAQEIFKKIKSPTAVSSMTGADLIRLGSIALGMTVSDIGGINTEAFKEVVSQFGEMTGWSTEQLVALKNKAVATYGATSTWDGGHLSTMNVIIGGFSDDEVKGLDSDDLQYISTEAIQALPPSKFKLLSADLLKELDAEQAQSVTEAQIAELSEEQKNALGSAESVNVTDGGDGDGDGNNTGGDGDGNGGGNGSMQAVVGYVSLLLPLIFSQWLI